MNSITVDYDSSHHRAVFKRSEACDDAAWTELRRVLIERGSNVVQVSDKEILIPWWSLLSITQHVQYVAQKIHSIYGVSFSFSQAATSHLKHASDRKKAYAELPESPISEADVNHRLAESGFKRVLKSYQVRNVARIHELPAAATFSVPGAGKTTEALAFYWLKRNDSDKLVVIAPKNAFAVWEEEIQECLPSDYQHVVRLQGGYSNISSLISKSPAICLINYHQIPTVQGLLGEFLSKHSCFVFLDESHRIKAGLRGVVGSRVLSLAHLPKMKLIMTGTPVPNSIDDLLPQFQFLYPEIPVTEISVAEKFRPIFVRTTKSELHLPQVTRAKLEVDLPEPHLDLYSALVSNIARKLKKLGATDRLILRRMSRSVMYLLEAASNPALLVNSPLAFHPLLSSALEEPSAKILVACRMARSLAKRNEKCVIWSSFVRTVEEIAALLQDIGAEYIHGGVDTSADQFSDDTREAKIRRFKEDRNCFVLVANPAACSESISLHRVCHNAIYVDRTYNAAQYIQSEDRIHRLGLSEDQETMVYILQSPSTIDISVDRRLNAKVDRMSQILNDSSLSIRALDLDDESIGLDAEDLSDLRKLILGEN